MEEPDKDGQIAGDQYLPRASVMMLVTKFTVFGPSISTFPLRVVSIFAPKNYLQSFTCCCPSSQPSMRLEYDVHMVEWIISTGRQCCCETRGRDSVRPYSPFVFLQQRLRSTCVPERLAKTMQLARCGVLNLANLSDGGLAVCCKIDFSNAVSQWNKERSTVPCSVCVIIRVRDA